MMEPFFALQKDRLVKMGNEKTSFYLSDFSSKPRWRRIITV